MIPVWSNYILEKEVHYFQQAVSDKNIMEGPVLLEFEKRLKDILQVKYAVGTSSGSAALALSLMAIGVKPGDEVIVPDITFIATANAPHMLGAEVVLAPVRGDRPLLDLEQVDKLITKKTKAIITVDLNGRISCSRELREKYSSRGIFIVDDACQAFTSRDLNGMAGTQADVGCFSFGITKMLTTAKGGLVVTNNDELYERMKLIKTQGMISVFEGDNYIYPGFNFKLPDVLAAIGLGQLERLDGKIEHMKRIDDMYREQLSKIEGITFFDKKEGELLAMTDIICEKRDNIRNLLNENDIICRPQGIPLHNAPYLQSVANYENSDTLQSKMLYLPSGPDQSFENVEKVIRIISENCA